MLGAAHFLTYALVVLAAREPPGQALDQTAAERFSRAEAEALIALADAAASGKRVPTDLAVTWHNDYLKAQHGTFVPFVVSVEAAPADMRAALLYVRLAARSPGAGRRMPDREEGFPVEDVHPVDLRTRTGTGARITRGFSATPGEYDLIVVLRERVDPRRPRLRRRAGVLTRQLTLPEFRTGELTTSSIILADGLASLDVPAVEEHLPDRPYLIGMNEIQPATDSLFRRSEELIVVFLVYNPFVTPERKFDVEVEYHFYARASDAGRRDSTPPSLQRAAREGERYFNRTKPQRFTPALMGPQFDPSAGHPLMAGQGVSLASFPVGEYRLEIRVTDVITGTTILRDVLFTIIS